MQEVFRHWDTATVGFEQPILRMRVSKLFLGTGTGVPATLLKFPSQRSIPMSVYMHEEDLAHAKELISAFRHIILNRRMGEDGYVPPVENPWMLL